MKNIKIIVNFSSVKNSLLLLTVFLCFIGCRKEPKHSYEPNSLKLEREVIGNGISSFTWTKVNTDDFVQYELYSSEEPIGDLYEGQLFNAQLIATIRDKKINFFIDSSINTLSLIHFKLVARLENSALSSNLVSDESLKIINLEGSNFNTNIILTIPSEGKFIFFQPNSNAQFKAYLIDYNEAKVLATTEITTNSQYSLKLGQFQNNTVLWNYYNGKLTVYDLNSLALIYESNLNLPSATYSLFLKNDYLTTYHASSSITPSNIATLHLNSKVMDTIIEQSTPFFNYFHQNVHPNYFFVEYPSLDSIGVYSIDNNGKMNTNETKIKTPLNNISNYTILEGDEERISQSQNYNKIWDQQFKLTTAFDLTNTASTAALSLTLASPNMQYYLYTGSNSNSRVYLVYKKGQSSPLQRIENTPFAATQNIFLDNEQAIVINRLNSDAGVKLIINKIPFE